MNPAILLTLHRLAWTISREQEERWSHLIDFAERNRQQDHREARAAEKAAGHKS